MTSVQHRMRAVPPASGRRLALLALLALAAALAATPAPARQAIGTDQSVVVVVCQYPDADPVKFSAQDWAGFLNGRINDYYRKATGEMTSFKFRPIEGVCKFADGYNDLAPPALAGWTRSNDPLVLFRESKQAVSYAESKVPGIWNAEQRVLTIVNKPKRARASSSIQYPTALGPRDLASALYSEDQGVDRKGKLVDADVSVIAHELGHMLGLPDLYREQAISPGPEPTELWDLMAFDRLQSFSAYSRVATGWIGCRYEILRPPFQNLIRTLNPPNSGGSTEALLLPTDPNLLSPPCTGPAPRGTFQGYMLEARAHLGVDATRKQTGDDGSDAPLISCDGQLGLPPSYEDGLLISHVVTARINPVEIRSKERGPGPGCPPDNPELGTAPFQQGQNDQFEEGNLRYRVEVLGPGEPGQPTGSLRVEIDSELVGPDLNVGDLWLDSPANGYENYFTPAIASGVPDLFGDPVYTPLNVEFRPFPNPPRITTGTATHIMRLYVQNQGNVDATGVSGRLYLLEPSLPALPDLGSRPDLLESLATKKYDVNIGNVPVSGTPAYVNIEVVPDRPFIGVFRLNDVPGEINPSNNARHEPFLVGQVHPGSPYQPVTQTLDVVNPNQTSHLVYATTTAPSGRWKARVRAKSANRPYSILRPGRKEEFKLFITPPNPAIAKPGELHPVTLNGFMSYADSFAKVAPLQVQVALSYRSALTLSVDTVGSGKAVLKGRLRYRRGTSLRSAAGQRIVLSLGGNNGSSAVGGPARPDLTATTSSTGRFTMSVNLTQGVDYWAMADFAGSLRYDGDRSPSVQIDQ